MDGGPAPHVAPRKWHANLNDENNNCRRSTYIPATSLNYHLTNMNHNAKNTSEIPLLKLWASVADPVFRAGVGGVSWMHVLSQTKWGGAEWFVYSRAAPCLSPPHVVLGGATHMQGSMMHRSPPPGYSPGSAKRHTFGMIRKKGGLWV